MSNETELTSCRKEIQKLTNKYNKLIEVAKWLKSSERLEKQSGTTVSKISLSSNNSNIEPVVASTSQKEQPEWQKYEIEAAELAKQIARLEIEDMNAE